MKEKSAKARAALNLPPAPGDEALLSGDRFKSIGKFLVISLLAGIVRIVLILRRQKDRQASRDKSRHAGRARTRKFGKRA